MDGKFLNNSGILMRLKKWHQSVNQTPNSWESNYLYLDELAGRNNVPTDKWLEKSIELFNLIVGKFGSDIDKVPFLHIPLRGANQYVVVDQVSKDWLQKNMDDNTPPNFHYCSIEYFHEYYETQLILCGANEDLASLFITDNRIYYYNKYDNIEGEYLRSLYVFDTSSL